MDIAVRPATPADYAQLIRIAAEGDFADCTSHYLSFIADMGRLLCATIDGTVVGFGGKISVADVAMVTDLFVATSVRGRGVGGRLLAALLDGNSRRMTFSAQHPAALAAYRRVGMQQRGRMLYLAGRATGGVSQLVPAQWTNDRKDLVDYLAHHGATVTARAVLSTNADAEVEVLRLDAVDAVGVCRELLGSFAAGTAVHLYVPEEHQLAGWLLAHDFVVTDFDISCASEGVELAPTLAVLHPGLA